MHASAEPVLDTKGLLNISQATAFMTGEPDIATYHDVNELRPTRKDNTLGKH